MFLPVLSALFAAPQAFAHPHPVLADTPVCVADQGDAFWCEDADGEREKCKKTNQRVANSRLAIESAREMQASAIQFDVRTTRDGVAILLDEKRVRRVAQSRENTECPEGKRVSKLTWDEINFACELESAQQHDDDQSLWRLEDALDALDSTGSYVLVELKDGPHPDTLALLEKFQRHNKEGLIVLARRSWRLDVVQDHFAATDVPAPLLIDVGGVTSQWATYDGGSVRHRFARRRKSDDRRSMGHVIHVSNLRDTPNRRLQYKVRPDFVATRDLASCFEAYPPTEPMIEVPPPAVSEAEAPDAEQAKVEGETEAMP